MPNSCMFYPYWYYTLLPICTHTGSYACVFVDYTFKIFYLLCFFVIQLRCVIEIKAVMHTTN